MKKIAVIGTGIMGNGIVTNFLKKGYKVIVWNRNKKKLNALVAKGATIATSPKTATEEADIVFEVTANDKSSMSVWLGKTGIMAGADNKKTLITCATLSISWTDELIKLCAKRRFVFFDMPMTGGRIGAESGKLTLLTGGKESKLKKLKKDLKPISNKVLYFGKAGSGMRFKLILNSIQAVHIAGLGEALRLAKDVGLEIKTVGDALADRPGGVITNLAWRDYQKVPNPINFSVEWITKDLNYAKRLSKKVKTPFLDMALKKYRKAIKKKLGQKDWTIINKIKLD